MPFFLLKLSEFFVRRYWLQLKRSSQLNFHLSGIVSNPFYNSSHYLSCENAPTNKGIVEYEITEKETKKKRCGLGQRSIGNIGIRFDFIH